MGLVRWFVGLVLALFFAAFAVANRQSVELFWSPVHPPLAVPLYAPALGLLAAGFLLGRFMAWLETLPMRLEKGKQKKRIKILEKELHKAQKATSVLETPAEWTALPGKTVSE